MITMQRNTMPFERDCRAGSYIKHFYHNMTRLYKVDRRRRAKNHYPCPCHKPIIPPFSIHQLLSSVKSSGYCIETSSILNLHNRHRSGLTLGGLPALPDSNVPEEVGAEEEQPHRPDSGVEMEPLEPQYCLDPGEEEDGLDHQ